MRIHSYFLITTIYLLPIECLPNRHLVWVPPTSAPVNPSEIPTVDRDENRSDKFDISDFPTPDHMAVNEAKTRTSLWSPEEIEANGTLACDISNAPGRYMIYCGGRLLEAVMATRLHADSKTFVDRSMKENRTGPMIMDQFKKRFPQPVTELTREEVKQFIDEHFDDENGDLKRCNISDWTATPTRISAIEDPTLRTFGLHLHGIWKDLCRQVDPKVDQDPQRYSLIYVPHPFIIPGGRFREFYYWDAYWIMKGLLVSGMRDTVRGMIRNFAHMIVTYGFIPNGGRVYYLKRSQPPMFAPMVYDYYQQTKDVEFIREMLPIIEKETEFWKNNRTINVTQNDQTHTVFQYRTKLTTPRPESYREDMTSAQTIPSIDGKQKFFQNLASAAESGWDFSTRWMRDDTDLTTIETTDILPVDLNAFLCYNLHIITHLHAEIGNTHKAKSWHSDYISFRRTFKQVFYVPNARGWYDFNLRTGSHNLNFYPSMAVPLFTQCYDPLSTSLSDDLYNQMEDMGVFQFKGGIPTSLKTDSEQQWDFPNGWSPLNHMMIEGLRKSSNPRMQQKAFHLAEKWVLSNHRVFQRDSIMWEKYNVVASKPRTGDGGEYAVQAGFGWTNGVILDLLSTYGERLSYPNINPPMNPLMSMFRDETEEPVTATASLRTYLVVIATYLIFFH